MELVHLIAAADKIRRSSAYAAGDKTTFKVLFKPGEVELPAPTDPVAYMTDVQAKLKFRMPPNARICVFGAGYGGLGAHFLNEGAKQVILIEPRFRFHAGLDMVIPLLDEIHAPEETETVKAFKAWPQQGHVQSLGQFDLVICPEGLDECPEPVETLTALLQMVQPNGGLVIEMLCGESTTVPAVKVNSWRPTKATFSALLCKITQAKEFREADGRAENRYLFAIPPGNPVKPEIKHVTYSEPMPVVVKKVVPPASKATPPVPPVFKPAQVEPEKHKPSEVHISPEVPPEAIEPIKTEIQVERTKPKKR